MEILADHQEIKSNNNFGLEFSKNKNESENRKTSLEKLKQYNSFKETSQQPNISHNTKSNNEIYSGLENFSKSFLPLPVGNQMCDETVLTNDIKSDNKKKEGNEKNR